jgi:hypothetical protein
LTLKETDLNFFLLLPESTPFAVIDAKDIATGVNNLSHNVPYLIRVFESVEEKCYVRTALGEIRVPSG